MFLYNILITGCSQWGIVVVMDERTGWFLEISTPWRTLRVGWMPEQGYIPPDLEERIDRDSRSFF